MVRSSNVGLKGNGSIVNLLQREGIPIFNQADESVRFSVIPEDDM